MFDWSWLIPLVVLVVYIISNLARISNEHSRRPPRRYPPAPTIPPANQGSKPTSAQGLENYWRDEQRRRREERLKAREAAASTARTTAATRPTETSRSVPPPLPKQPPVHQRSAPPIPSQTLPRTTLLTTRTSEPPAIKPPEPETSDSDFAPLAESEVHSQAAQSARTAYQIRKRTALASGSAVSAQVLEMLDDANSARVALVLQEILGPPLSRRRRRR